jgi:mannitol-1-/sugar-/sorbitol-6-phosphatase
VLFDLDGVLVDSTASIEKQWRRWALSKGLPAEPFLKVCHGRRALETIQLAAPHLDAAGEVAAFRPDDFPDGATIQPVAGAVRLLDALPPAGWAVATSGPRAMATARLVEAGLPLPRVLICAEDVLHGKPEPDVYLAAAVALSAPPSECVVIEDAPAGIQAARAARMRVIALTTTHPLPELEADAWTESLDGIELRRLDPGPDGALHLELAVSEPRLPPK